MKSKHKLENCREIFFTFQVAQLYSVAEASKNETGGGEGVEVVNHGLNLFKVIVI